MTTPMRGEVNRFSKNVGQGMAVRANNVGKTIFLTPFFPAINQATEIVVPKAAKPMIHGYGRQCIGACLTNSKGKTTRTDNTITNHAGHFGAPPPPAETGVCSDLFHKK